MLKVEFEPVTFDHKMLKLGFEPQFFFPENAHEFDHFLDFF